MTMVAISGAQARNENAGVSAVVQHGLDPSRFHRMPDQGYLLFLGRYDRVKGVAQAIEVAARARAVLFPIQWEEPFGLVMIIEAMLSGVPVLGLARGSVPEVIEDGVTA
jgi:glycosyltransferase involved in cell wall biosynthesis